MRMIKYATRTPLSRRLGAALTPCAAACFESMQALSPTGVFAPVRTPGETG